MPLTDAFNISPDGPPHGTGTGAVARDGRARRPRPAPFSLRLTDDERAQLISDARGLPLGTYIKAKLMDTPPSRRHRTGLRAIDRTALAQVLARLGQSRLASNLNQLAHAANIGALPVDPEVEAELIAAVHEVRAIRTLLMTALGLMPGSAP
ncbi:MAG: hypothetical protein NW205_10240 [Hyphomicrobiaceae bacterium]|nr:hypothetical protein [Hyphomicrobiaceae bacterium]